uniref:Uncharacterized protein n=1 Tax=Arundo donax TaxID=35708 RepID=A0A0A9AUX0_ARUDO
MVGASCTSKIGSRGAQVCLLQGVSEADGSRVTGGATSSREAGR